MFLFRPGTAVTGQLDRGGRTRLDQLACRPPAAEPLSVGLRASVVDSSECVTRAPVKSIWRLRESGFAVAWRRPPTSHGARTRNWLQPSGVRNCWSGASIAVGRFLCWLWPTGAPGGEFALWVGGELAISTPLFGSAGYRGMRFRPGREDGVSSTGLNSTRKSIESARREPLD